MLMPQLPGIHVGGSGTGQPVQQTCIETSVVSEAVFNGTVE